MCGEDDEIGSLLQRLAADWELYNPKLTQTTAQGRGSEMKDKRRKRRRSKRKRQTSTVFGTFTPKNLGGFLLVEGEIVSRWASDTAPPLSPPTTLSPKDPYPVPIVRPLEHIIDNTSRGVIRNFGGTDGGMAI